MAALTDILSIPNKRAKRTFAWLLWALVLLLIAGNFILAVVDPLFLMGSSIYQDFSVLILVVCFASIGTLIILRASSHPIGWIYLWVSFTFVLQQTLINIAKFVINYHQAVQALGVWAAWASDWTGIIFFGAIVTLPFLYYPDGRLLTPRWRYVVWSLICLITLGVITKMISPGGLDNFPEIQNPMGIPALAALSKTVNQTTNFLFPIEIAVCAFSQVLRYRRSRDIERLQIKWLVYGAVVPILLMITLSMILGNNQSSLVDAIVNWLLLLSILMIPLSTGLAILKYRLYSIDNLIRRTLQYSLLTGLLALVYFSSVVLLQSMLTLLVRDLGPVVGDYYSGFGLQPGIQPLEDSMSEAVNIQPPAVTIVLSTLVVAALFNPFRRRLQSFIDRRFYRQKYDAEKALAGFAAHARSETDLTQLSIHLTASVRDALQPQKISLWLKPVETRSGNPDGGLSQ